VSDVGDQYAEAKALVAGRTDPAAEAGIAGLLRRACAAAVRTLSASGAGISMMTDHSTRGICAASDLDSEHLEEVQFTLGEGPCMDAHASRRPVLLPDLAHGAMTRWPVYAPAVYDKGVRAVFAFPLQIGAARLGVLDIFRDHAGALGAGELTQAVLLADVTVAVLLDQHEQGGQRPDPGASGRGHRGPCGIVPRSGDGRGATGREPRRCHGADPRLRLHRRPSSQRGGQRHRRPPASLRF
jgi:hypothetical protein